MAIGKLKSLDNVDKSQDVSRLNQLIDIISADINNTANRRRYSSFVSGNTTEVDSSLFKTIFDQDHTLQSANALFDMSFGLYTNVDSQLNFVGSTVVTDLANKKIDSSGKYIFESTTSNMIREKISVYRQYAQSLLGSSTAVFRTSHNADQTLTNNIINEALFINVKRLFKRDQISKGTVGLKFFNRVGNNEELAVNALNATNGTLFTSPNETFLGRSAFSNNVDFVNDTVFIYDTNASLYYNVGVSGEVATLKLMLGNNTPKDCGLVFYDMGIIVLDVNVIFNLLDPVQGVIDFPDAAAGNATFNLDGATQDVVIPAGKKPLGNVVEGNIVAATLKNFLQLATIEQIIDHFCNTRFTAATDTAFTFQNETIINSTIYFCNAGVGDFNYSTNPTYTDENGKIIVVKNLTDQPFSYITTVGLHSNTGDLLAVAKLSRPVEKNPNNQLSIRVRLDY